MLSADEFLDAEELSDSKHFYYAGMATAMAGGSFEHGRLAMNLGSALHGALRGRGCAVVGSEVVIQTGSKEMYTYPDLTVICGPVERMEGRRNVITNPEFLVEVLSPGLEGRDRLSPTVMQFVLIRQDKPLMEIHTRCEDGGWRITEVMGLAGECVFSAMGCSVPMGAIYEGVLELA